MSLKELFRRPQTPPPPARDAAADALIDSYVAWREASSDVRAAYERWIDWESDDRDLGFAGYLATLEREEHAARVYQRQIERVCRASRGPTDAEPRSEAP